MIHMVSNDSAIMQTYSVREGFLDFCNLTLQPFEIMSVILG